MARCSRDGPVGVRDGPSIGQALARGATGRCPLCGSRGIFTPSRLELREGCRTCGLHFEREDGYWIGAVYVVMALVLAVFVLVTAGSIAVFWPDVPWTGVTIAAIIANGVVAVGAHGWAKSMWLGVSWAFAPADVAEQADILTRRAAMERDRGDSE